MSNPLQLTEPLSDALFACVYLWAHGRPCSAQNWKRPPGSIKTRLPAVESWWYA